MPSDMHDLEKEFADLDGQVRLDDLEDESGAGQPNVRRNESIRILPVSIAVVALLTFGIVVFYAYSQGVRSGSEVAAPLLTPDHAAKVLPDDPGGMKVPHQDKLVYNQIEEKVDDSKVERLLPPPEVPVKPPAAKPTKSDVPPIPSITGPIAPKVKSKEPLLINPDSEKEEDAALSQETLAAPSVVPAPIPTAPAVEEVKKPVTKPETKTVPETTVKKVEVPAKKDETPALTQKTSSSKNINVKTDWRVQIGAVGSNAKAQSEFKRHQSQQEDILGSLSLEVQKVKVNGKDYFRIRMGPMISRNKASDLCSKLKKRKIDCIIVAPDK